MLKVADSPETSEAVSGETTVRRCLIVFLAVLAGLWAVALAVVAIQTHVFHRVYPYDTLFFIPNVRFSDFIDFYPKSAVHENYDFFLSPLTFPFSYPAPLLMCFVSLFHFSQPLLGYLVILFVFACILGVSATLMIPRHLGQRRLIVLSSAAAIFSFGFFFLLDRANLEGFVWIATSIGILCFARGRFVPAAIFLGLAASMKIFPGALLLMFIAKRRYRDFVVSLLAVGAFTIGSLWATGPSIAIAAGGVAQGVEYVRQHQILVFQPTEIGFDHSVFGYFKQLAVRITGDVARVDSILPRIYLAYMLLAVLGFAAIYFGRLRHMPVLNHLLALSALSIALPFISYEYTLVHLAAPFIVLVFFLGQDVDSGRAHLTRSQILALLLPYALLFAPLSYLIDHGLGYGGQIKALALIYLIGVASWIPLPSSMFGELDGISGVAVSR